MDHLKKALASNLLKFRKKSGLTQAELAESAGLSLGYIQKIEYMSAWPNAESFEAIARALGISESDLFKDPTDDHHNLDMTRSELLGEIVAGLAAMDEDELLSILHFIETLSSSKPSKPFAG